MDNGNHIEEAPVNSYYGRSSAAATLLPSSTYLKASASLLADTAGHHNSLSVTSSDISQLASTAAKAYLDAAKAASQAATLTVEAAADLISSRDVEGRTAVAMAAANGHYKVMEHYCTR
jgi:ankyrin repeat protein